MAGAKKKKAAPKKNGGLLSFISDGIQGAVTDVVDMPTSPEEIQSAVAEQRARKAREAEAAAAQKQMTPEEVKKINAGYADPGAEFLKKSIFGSFFQ